MERRQVKASRGCGREARTIMLSYESLLKF
ncbi:MAG: hypothetical protein AVDCRST_MAG90-2626, partial [uncultured Microvirga sp.]